MDMVAPELRPLVLDLILFEAAYTPLTSENLPNLRQAYRDSYRKFTITASDYELRTIGSAAGQHGVPIFILNADRRRCRPALLHLHGGGFVMGSAAMDLARLKRMATLLDMVVVSVEYRLAPETDWRGSCEDTYVALRWIHAEASQLGIDRRRIGLLGESAGGGHAALLSSIARDRREVSIAFQCLVYPMLDDRTGVDGSIESHLGVVGWSAQHNQFGWSAFLGRAAGGENVPQAAVPARQTNLSGLPPTWIGVGDLDLFLQEDLAYSHALRSAGISTSTLTVPGAFHGFDEISRIAGKEGVLTRQFESKILAAIAAGLAR